MTASSPSAPNPRGLFWLILFLLTLLAALIIWLTVGFGLNRGPSVGNLMQIEPIAGGIVIPQPTAVAPSAIDDIVLDGSVPPELLELVFVPEQPVLITNQATSGSAGQMPVYAEPRLDSDIRNIYPSGTVLTVLEPSGDYGGYPIEIEGLSWVRVRDSSGLVGWTKAGMLYPVAAVEASAAVPLIVQPEGSEPAPDEPAPDEPAPDEPAPDEPAQAPAESVPAESTAVPQQEPTPTSTPAG